MKPSDQRTPPEVRLPRGYDDASQQADGATPQATGRWMSPEELEAAVEAGELHYDRSSFWAGRSPLTGKPVGITDDRHLMLIAGSRAGKGRAVIIPNLLEHRGSALNVDPKGENAEKTAARRGFGTSKIEGLGQNVRILDPFGTTKGADDYKTSFNPLDMIDPCDPEACEIAELIADALVVKGADKDAHWDETGRALIQAVILLVATDPEFAERRDLVTVKRLIQGTDPAVRGGEGDD